jgi:2-polyprenyl-3-methyl-5-hydroxy-6-metoxy-1,4-benzoquinol methylase
MATTSHAVANSAIENYILGNSAHEQERLKRQGKFLERWTEQFMSSAGLVPGMRVLDLGCGMGDVSLLAARLVGKSGTVTGIDRDGVVVEKARERASSHEYGARIDFIQAELLDFRSTHQFDAVVGRYVLLYQPDPLAAILHAAGQVRSGGIVFFHEMHFSNAIRSYPDGTLFARMQSLIADIFRRSGFWADLGLHLTRLFLAAGLGWPTIKPEAPGDRNSTESTAAHRAVRSRNRRGTRRRYARREDGRGSARPFNPNHGPASVRSLGQKTFAALNECALQLGTTHVTNPVM